MDEQFAVIEEQTRIRIKERLDAVVEHSKIHLEIILEDIVERYRFVWKKASKFQQSSKP